MSSTKTPGGSDIFTHILKGIRYGVGYAERYVKNAISQIKWTFKQSKWTHGKFVSLHNHSFGEPPHPVTNGIACVVIGIGGLIVLKFLLLWTFLKSI